MVSSRQVIPADGSTGVPTNVQIVLGYETTNPGITDHPKLQTAEGVDILVTITQPLNNTTSLPHLQTFVMVPKASLQPNTKYRVLSDFGPLPCVQNQFYTGSLTIPPCLAGGYFDGGVLPIDAGAASSVAIASFTTGQGPDDVTPELLGALTYTTGSSFSCDYSACCGPYRGYTVGFNWPTATDVGGVAFYEVAYERNTILLPFREAALDPSAPTSVKLVGALLCSGGMSSPAMGSGARFVAKPGLYQVFAVDLAGNRSAPVSVSVASECGGILDAGADGSTVSDVPIDSATVIDVQDRADKPIVIAFPPDATVDTAMPDASLPGTGGTAGISGTGGTAGSPGSGGVVGLPGTGGASGPLTGTSRQDASTGTPRPSNSGCSCQVGGAQGNSAGLVLFALGMLLTRKLRRRR